jgi:hypothetical protein
MPTAVDNIAEQRAIASRLREMAEETRHHASRLRLIEAARWFEQDADVAERIERESSPPSKAGGAP